MTTIYAEKILPFHRYTVAIISMVTRYYTKVAVPKIKLIEQNIRCIDNPPVHEVATNIIRLKPEAVLQQIVHVV